MEMQNARILIFVLLLSVLLSAIPATAQFQGQPVNNAIVVATCGTVPAGFQPANSRGQVTVDVNGQTCINGTISGGNAAASATGAAVPAAADYIGASVGGTLTGVTATNNTGKISLDVNITGGAAAGGTSSNFAAAFPSAGTAIGAKNGANMVNLTADGSGNLNTAIAAALPAGTNVIGHAIIDSGSTTAATQSGTWNITNISGTISLPTGAATAAKQPALGTAGSASTDVITIQGIASMTPLLSNMTQIGGASLSLGQKTMANSIPVVVASDQTPVGQATMANSAPVVIASDQAGFPVQPIAATTGGTTPCYITSAASTNSTNCKASAGQIYHISAINTTTTNYFLRLYNASSAPTCSSSTGFIRSIPVLGAAANGSGVVEDIVVGEVYGTGIGFCLTAGGANNDNTNAATGLYVDIDYK